MKPAPVSGATLERLKVELDMIRYDIADLAPVRRRRLARTLAAIEKLFCLDRMGEGGDHG